MCTFFQLYLLLLHIRGVHGLAAGRTFYEPVRPDGAQNETLISNNVTYSVFEIKVLFHAPLGCIHIETVRPEFFLCTPLVYYNDN